MVPTCSLVEMIGMDGSVSYKVKRYSDSFALLGQSDWYSTQEAAELEGLPSLQQPGDQLEHTLVDYHSLLG